MELEKTLKSLEESIEKAEEFCRPKDGETKEEALERIKQENYKSGLDLINGRLDKIAFYEALLLKSKPEKATEIEEYIAQSLECHRAKYRGMSAKELEAEMLLDTINSILGGI